MNKLLLSAALLAASNLYATLIDIQEIRLLSRAQDVEQLKVYTASQEVQFQDGRTFGGSVAVSGNPSNFDSRSQVLSTLANLENVLIWNVETLLFGLNTSNLISMDFRVTEPSTFNLSIIDPTISIGSILGNPGTSGTLPIGDYQFTYLDSWNEPRVAREPAGFDLQIITQRVPDTASTLLLLSLALIPLALFHDSRIRSNS